MRLLSPRDLAEALGVSESSLKRWVDAGRITATRTDGGHRKIRLSEAVRFIRESGSPIVHPELLDMPEVAAAALHSTSEDRLLRYLEEGDAFAVRGWLLARYLAGTSVAELCDGPIRHAMIAIGELWKDSARGIFIEHRATDVCFQALAHLRSTFPQPTAGPVAIGGGCAGDPYLLPSFMAAMVVGSEGMRAHNLGPDTPVAAMAHAVTQHAPSLVWISATVVPRHLDEVAHFLDTLPTSVTAVVGGRACAPILAASPRARHVATMVELAAIVRTIVTPPAA